MRRVWGIAFGMLAVLLFASIPAQALPITEQLTVTDEHLLAGGVAERIEAINDQTVIPLNLYPYPAYNYRYSNHLFPYYTNDLVTKLASDNYTHFWWQYFYLISELGLNGVRLGGFNGWGMSWMHATWYNDRPTWDAVIDPMFAMAREAGVYIIFSFGGEASPDYTFSRTSNVYGTSVPDPMAGSLVDVGSECYLHYMDWIGEVMTHYKNEVSLGMWELLNEPDGDAPWTHYWHTLPNEDASWAYWMSNFMDDAIAEEHSHLITMGTASGLFHTWGQTEFNRQNNYSNDVGHSHVYGSSEDDYLIHDQASWSVALKKHWFMGEAGYSDSGPPWGIYYWPWLDAIAASHNASIAWMTLWRMPGYPVSSANISAIPDVPAGYWYVAPGTSGGGSGGSVTIPFVSELLSGPGGNYLILGIIGAGIWFGAMGGRRKR
jgi:hypothetical protein